MSISYFIGQKYYPIKYDLKRIFLYFALAVAFYIAAMYPQIDNEILRLAYRTVFLVVFTAVIIKKDLPLKEIPVIGKYVSNNKKNK